MTSNLNRQNMKEKTVTLDVFDFASTMAATALLSPKEQVAVEIAIKSLVKDKEMFIDIMETKRHMLSQIINHLEGI